MTLKSKNHSVQSLSSSARWRHVRGHLKAAWRRPANQIGVTTVRYSAPVGNETENPGTQHINLWSDPQASRVREEARSAPPSRSPGSELSTWITDRYRSGWCLEDALAVAQNLSDATIVELSGCFNQSIDDEVRGRWARFAEKDRRHQNDVDVWVNALNHKFNDARGAATFRAALALSSISRKVGSLQFTASNRQIAEAAAIGAATPNGADPKTARRALDRLSAMGWVTISKSGQKSGINKVTLVRPHGNSYPNTGIEISNGADTAIANTDPHNIPFVCGPLMEEEALSELFSHSGIGFTSYRIFVPLREAGSMSVAELHSVTGIPSRTIRNCLRRMMEADLVYEVSPGVWALTGLTLESSERALNLQNRREHRRVGFERQREGFNRYFEIQYPM